MTSLTDRARQGDALAIAHLLTQSMVRQGIVARGYWLCVQLCLELEAPTSISQESMVPRIQRGLERLNLTLRVSQPATWERFGLCARRAILYISGSVYCLCP
jgi:hypothetical protein